MKVFDAKHIKNIVLLGAAKSGKTTLAETMLFEAGLINRRGSVEDKNTVSDYHEIEHERGNSVYATALHTEWRDYKINIIDTPGLDDFIGEIISSVRVADTCVLLINAQHGIEVGTELIWNYADRYQKPVILAVNQLDHPKSNWDQTLESMQKRFGSAATVMQYPVNQGDGFDSIIDLLKMTMYKFPAGGGKPEKLPIPDDQKDKAEALHNELVEKAAENDEQLMELYFEKGSLDEDEMRQGLKIGMLNHEVFPIFCLSAKQNMGSGRMMGFIDNVAPSATEMKPEPTEDDGTITAETDGDPVLFIFKTLVEPNLGKMSFFKVISGTLKVGADLVNHQTGQTERLNQLFIMDGKNRNPVEKLVVGDIGATLKLKSTETNHTLHPKGKEVAIKPIQFPGPRIRTAIIAKNKSDDEKLGEVLKKIHQEDPTVVVEYSRELKQLILSCQGELHLAMVRWALENTYKLDVDYITPRIPYRETIQKAADASYRHKKQSGGAGQFGEVFLKIEPFHEGMPEPTGLNIRNKDETDLPWGGKLVFYNCIVGGVIDLRFLPSIKKGILEKMEEEGEQFSNASADDDQYFRDLVTWLAGNFTVEGGQEAMAGLLEIPERPTAVFAMSDEMAFGAMRTIRDAGLRIPDDISVVGFDDHELSDVFGLTTIRQQVDQHGAVAARLLLDLMDDDEVSHRVVDTELVVRTSTAPPSTISASMSRV